MKHKQERITETLTKLNRINKMRGVALKAFVAGKRRGRADAFHLAREAVEKLKKERERIEREYPRGCGICLLSKALAAIDKAEKEEK